MFKDDLKAAHERIAALERELEQLRQKLAKDKAGRKGLLVRLRLRWASWRVERQKQRASGAENAKRKIPLHVMLLVAGMMLSLGGSIFLILHRRNQLSEMETEIARRDAELDKQIQRLNRTIPLHITERSRFPSEVPASCSARVKGVGSVTCEVEVRCGEHLLYYHGGLSCTLQDNGAFSMKDVEKEPEDRLNMSFDGQQMVVWQKGMANHLGFRVVLETDGKP